MSPIPIHHAKQSTNVSIYSKWSNVVKWSTNSVDTRWFQLFRI